MPQMWPREGWLSVCAVSVYTKSLAGTTDSCKARLQWGPLKCAGTSYASLGCDGPAIPPAALDGDLAAQLNRALTEGADPNAMDADGYTPLIFAVCNNNTDCVAKLIEAGAHPDCYTDKGRTPLNSAASSGYTAWCGIRLLLPAVLRSILFHHMGMGPLHRCTTQLILGTLKLSVRY